MPMSDELLRRGRDLALKFRHHLLPDLLAGRATSSVHVAKETANEILAVFDRLLAGSDVVPGVGGSAEGWSGTAVVGRKRSNIMPGSADSQGGSRRRRCRASSSSRTIVVNNPDDGMSWRKYGQKNIQNSNNPRGYFRCADKSGQGCKAQKQVQQSDHDPSSFLVTYFGEHTCCHPEALAAAAVAGKVDATAGNLISFGSNDSTAMSPVPLSSSPVPTFNQEGGGAGTDEEAISGVPIVESADAALWDDELLYLWSLPLIDAKPFEFDEEVGSCWRE